MRWRRYNDLAKCVAKFIFALICLAIIIEWLRYRYYGLLLDNGEHPVMKEYGQLLPPPRSQDDKADTAVARENDGRLERITETCDKNNENSNFAHRSIDWRYFERNRQDKMSKVWWEPFFVSDKLKLIYCHNPSVASNSILRYLVKLSYQGDSAVRDGDGDSQDEKKDLNSPYVRPLGDYPHQTAAHLMQTYTKFTWVSNPLDRLVSAWQDKLTKYDADLTGKGVGQLIIRRYRQNATFEETRKGYPVTLEEFFRYLVDTPSDEYEILWKPMHDVCMFCAINYDFVGHLENVEQEMSYFRRRYADRPGGQQMEMPTSPLEDKEQLVQKLPRRLLENVLETHKLDYEMFGYNLTADHSRTGKDL